MATDAELQALYSRVDALLAEIETNPALTGRFVGGTNAAPSMRGNNDANTGVNIPGGDQLDLVTNGTSRVSVNGTAATFAVPLKGAGITGADGLMHRGGTVGNRYVRYECGWQEVYMTQILINNLSNNRLYADVTMPASFVSNESYAIGHPTFRAPGAGAQSVSYAVNASLNSTQIKAAHYGNKTNNSFRIWVEAILGEVNFVNGDALTVDLIVKGDWR